MPLIVELDSKVVPILQDIGRLTGIDSYEEILNRALAVMYWAAREDHRGRTVVSLDKSEGTYQRLKIVRIKRPAPASMIDINAAAANLKAAAAAKIKTTPKATPSLNIAAMG